MYKKCIKMHKKEMCIYTSEDHSPRKRHEPFIHSVTRKYIQNRHRRVYLHDSDDIKFQNVLTQLCLTHCDSSDGSQAPLPFTITRSLLKLTSTELVILSNQLILCHPLSSCPQSFPKSGSSPMSRLLA